MFNFSIFVKSINNMVNKILLFTFIFCCLYVLKEAFLFIKALFTDGKYDITKVRLLGLSGSISWIITLLITGLGI